MIAAEKAALMPAVAKLVPCASDFANPACSLRVQICDASSSAFTGQGAPKRPLPSGNGIAPPKRALAVYFQRVRLAAPDCSRGAQQHTGMPS